MDELHRAHVLAVFVKQLERIGRLPALRAAPSNTERPAGGDLGAAELATAQAEVDGLRAASESILFNGALFPASLEGENKFKAAFIKKLHAAASPADWKAASDNMSLYGDDSSGAESFRQGVAAVDQRLKDKLEDIMHMQQQQQQQQRPTKGAGAGETPVNGLPERIRLDDSAPLHLNAGHPLVECLADSEAKRARQLLHTTTSADVVFDNTKLCSAVLEFVDRGHWLYIAPVSRSVRATYMAVLAQSGWDARWLCRTTIYAASQSLTAFKYALAHGLNEPVLRAYTGRKHFKLKYTPLLDTLEVRSSIGATCSHDIMAATADAAQADKHHKGDAGSRLNFWHICAWPAAAAGADVGQLTNWGNLAQSLSNKGAGMQWSSKGVLMLAVRLAERGDNGSVLTWLLQLPSHEKVPSFFLPFLCSVAVEAGHLHTLQFLLSSVPELIKGRTEPSDNVQWPDILAGYDKADLVAPTRYDAEEHPLELLDTAIANGHAHIIDWLRGSDCVPPHAYTDYSAVAAAYGGHLSLLQWLHAQPQQCPWDDEAVVEATLLSPDASPEQLAWLRSAGALDWSSAAVRTRHLVDAVALGFTGKPDMVEWLLSEGARWPNSMEEAIVSGAWGAAEVEMALGLGCPWEEAWSIACQVLEDNSDAAAVEYLHMLGAPCLCDSRKADSELEEETDDSESHTVVHYSELAHAV